jgi:hypothetical protein
VGVKECVDITLGKIWASFTARALPPIKEIRYRNWPTTWRLSTSFIVCQSPIRQGKPITNRKPLEPCGDIGHPRFALFISLKLMPPSFRPVTNALSFPAVRVWRAMDQI